MNMLWSWCGVIDSVLLLRLNPHCAESVIKSFKKECVSTY